MGGRYARVVVDVPNARVDRHFDYMIPDRLAGVVQPGSRVLVPFGPRSVSGFVVGQSDAPEVAEVRDILDCVRDSPPIPEDLLEVATWMSRTYLCLLVEALRAMVPSGTKVESSRTVSLKVGPKLARAVRLVPGAGDPEALVQSLSRRSPAQAAIVHALLERGREITRAELLGTMGYSASALNSLVRSGIVERVDVTVERDPFRGLPVEHTAPPELSPDQAAAVAKLEAAMDSGGGVVVVHGVTSSGKTEVYLRMLERSVRMGRQGIMLVPDISLTPQMVDRVRGRFGRRVAVLHSALGAGERLDEWARIRRGDADVVVGARSAVFAPVPRLGVIVVDEEHDTSYKQDESPRYHAVEVAEWRASRAGALVILGSATPSVETYYRSEIGVYGRIELLKRIDDRPLPDVHVVDMRAELKSGNRSIFSRRLQAHLAERLASGQQAILFMNRRGFSTFVLCRDCGYVVTCPNCDVSLTYHARMPAMTCHYCNHTTPVPDICPSCGGERIRYFGAGTEKIEDEVKKLFPEARVARMDVDTTRRKGAHREILTSFRTGRVDVLVGTQMVAKGLDFPSVTLVGVVSADTALNLPDFRASERTFQLIAQVAGRSGRGPVRGVVIVQTYNPTHYSITTASHHDYRRFYEQEVAARFETGFPPARELLRVLVSAEDEPSAARAAGAIAAVCRDRAAGHDVSVEVVGPAPAPIERIAGKFRWQVLLLAADGCALREVAVKGVRESGCAGRKAGVTITMNVNPQSIL
ncbi:MAG: primosomal protein N' [Firmicutes bacterium]|nr:primosomal protein N' [Bacillota bacterium]